MVCHKRQNLSIEQDSMVGRNLVGETGEVIQSIERNSIMVWAQYIEFPHIHCHAQCQT